MHARTGAWLAIGALVLTASAGCASAQERYCSTLKDDKPRLESLGKAAATPGSDVLGTTLTLLESLQRKAPPDVRPDYDTVVAAYQALEGALGAAHVDPKRWRPGTRPAGITDGQYRSITQAAHGLVSSDVLAASAHIEDHAQQVCEVNLSGNGGL